MKKSVLFAVTFALIILSSFLIHADPLDTLADQNQAIDNQLGKITDITENPSEHTDAYLKQEWDKIILTKHYIGPIHQFFKDNSLIFKILFAEDYQISLTMLVILILWFFFAFKISKLIKYSGLVKENFALPLGFLIVILMAHMRILGWISSSFIGFMLEKDSWWMRLIIIFSGVIALFFVNYILLLIEKTEKAKSTQNLNTSLKKNTKNLEDFNKELKSKD